MDRDHDSGAWYGKFSEKWSKLGSHSGDSCGPSALWRVLAALFCGPIVVSGALEAVDIALTFAMVAILTTVVDFLTGDAHTAIVAIAAAFALFVRTLCVTCITVKVMMAVGAVLVQVGSVFRAILRNVSYAITLRTSVNVSRPIVHTHGM